MIEAVRIESDEGGFVLVLGGDLVEEAERYLDGRCGRCGDPKARHVPRRVVLSPGSAGEIRLLCRSQPTFYTERDGDLSLRLSQDAALALLAAAEAEIGPWRAEMREARAEYERTRDVPDPADGYDPADSKHPTWAERTADAADRLRKREREG